MNGPILGPELPLVHRYLWEAGDKQAVGPAIAAAAAQVAATAEISDEDQVLDIAAGTGYTAAAAARLGGRVWGVDLCPDLFAATRTPALVAPAERVRWLEGQGGQMSFDDNTFHKLTSFFGLPFAPYHALAVADAVRVCRRGATLAVAAWTQESLIGQILRVLVNYLPTPPEGSDSVLRWGDPAYLRVLFGRAGARVTIGRGEVPFVFPSFDAVTTVLGDRYGTGAKRELATIISGAAATSGGRWEATSEFLIVRVDLP